MSWLAGSTRSCAKVVVDSSTFFSAIYNRYGNEARLFELADQGRIAIIIPEYVLDEMKAVFLLKHMNFSIVVDIIDTYRNINLESLEDITDEEAAIACELIGDATDRPIFIFASRQIAQDERTYLVSGDKVFFTPDVRTALNGKVLRTREFIEKYG